MAPRRVSSTVRTEACAAQPWNAVPSYATSSSTPWITSIGGLVGILERIAPVVSRRHADRSVDRRIGPRIGGVVAGFFRGFGVFRNARIGGRCSIGCSIGGECRRVRR